MSGDEAFITLGSVVASVWLWGAYWLAAPRVARLGPATHPGRSTWLLPIVAAIIIAGVLRNLAASDVRDAPPYLAQYFALGMVWVYAMGWAGTYLGLSVRDDVLERANRAAFWACAGLYVGAALTYGGANVGEGPGWWCVVIAGGVATFGFLVAGYLLLTLGDLHDAVTIERSLPAGTLVGLVFVALGLVAGRGAAGDWEGLGPALEDFVLHGWPLAPLALVGAIVGRALARVPASQAQPIAVAGGVALVAAAGWWVGVYLPPP